MGAYTKDIIERARRWARQDIERQKAEAVDGEVPENHLKAIKVMVVADAFDRLDVLEGQQGTWDSLGATLAGLAQFAIESIPPERGMTSAEDRIVGLLRVAGLAHRQLIERGREDGLGHVWAAQAPEVQVYLDRRQATRGA